MFTYFAGITSLDALKVRYRKLALDNHPDRGGSDKIMAAINAEYANSLEWIKKNGTTPQERQQAAAEIPEEFTAAAMAALKYDDVIIEMVGRWMWATGNTYAHKDALKAAGWKWASKKHAWYWHTAEDAVSRGSKLSLDEIKMKYGAERLNSYGMQYALT